MFKYLMIIVLLSTCVMSKPRYSDLDEDEQLLYRAAYETPSYEHNQYDDEDMEVGKLDLLKDGLWAIKAELKQLKAFKKALAANMLVTKLKLKELMTHHHQKHHHESIDKKKSTYNYQPSSYQEYGAHQYEHDPYQGY